MEKFSSEREFSINMKKTILIQRILSTSNPNTEAAESPFFSFSFPSKCYTLEVHTLRFERLPYYHHTKNDEA